VLRAQAYTFSVDYWSLGCILFEFLAGFPPFSGSTQDETWTNLKNWTKVLSRPTYDKPEDLVFNLRDVSWDIITRYDVSRGSPNHSLINRRLSRLIAHASVRYSTFEQVTAHPFFTASKTDFSRLRSRLPPFVPSLDSEVDTGYYDDFTSLEDMAKYAEVQAKKNNVDKMGPKEGVEEGKRGVWVGFTFGKTGVGKETKAALRGGRDDSAVDDDGAPEGLFTIF
jgi:cell cycle protein kinase DBF2